jgi:hypothetical protein
MSYLQTNWTQWKQLLWDGLSLEQLNTSNEVVQQCEEYLSKRNTPLKIVDMFNVNGIVSDSRGL